MTTHSRTIDPSREMRDMVDLMNLDIRSITLSLNLNGCASRSIKTLCNRIEARIRASAGNLDSTCRQVERDLGVPIINRRLAITPVANLGAGHSSRGLIDIARTVDRVAADLEIDFVGGYSALVQKGWTPEARRLVDTIPDVLSSTDRICASVAVASTFAGINMDAIARLGQILKETAELTRDLNGFGCAKLVALSNPMADNPFMAGAFHGDGEPDCTINVAVSGPGVVRTAIEELDCGPNGSADLMSIATTIKRAAARVTAAGDLVGRTVASRLGIPFGVVDLSLAPTPTEGDSVGEILMAMGVKSIGGPGSTAALALLNDAVKKGGSFAAPSVGGLSGAFLAVAEDLAFANAAKTGSLTLPKLEAMTAVCSVGLDMIAVPGDTDAETLSALIADEMAIGVINNKATAVRIIPVPGKTAGDIAVFGGLFGQTTVLPIPGIVAGSHFVRRGGRIPAPLNSLKN